MNIQASYNGVTESGQLWGCSAPPKCLPSCAHVTSTRKQFHEIVVSHSSIRLPLYTPAPIILFFFFCFSGPHPQHRAFPRVGVRSELQLPACTTATATRDLSHIFNLHHSSWQRQMLNPLMEARDQTYGY